MLLEAEGWNASQVIAFDPALKQLHLILLHRPIPILGMLNQLLHQLERIKQSQVNPLTIRHRQMRRIPRERDPRHRLPRLTFSREAVQRPHAEVLGVRGYVALDGAPGAVQLVVEQLGARGGHVVQRKGAVAQGGFGRREAKVHPVRAVALALRDELFAVAD